MVVNLMMTEESQSCTLYYTCVWQRQVSTKHINRVLIVWNFEKLEIWIWTIQALKRLYFALYIRNCIKKMRKYKHGKKWNLDLITLSTWQFAFVEIGESINYHTLIEQERLLNFVMKIEGWLSEMKKNVENCALFWEWRVGCASVIPLVSLLVFEINRYLCNQPIKTCLISRCF